MCEAIGKIYANDIEEVVMYGSYARGQETDESDIDMAIVLKANQTDEQYDQLTDVVVDYELDIGITLSIISIEKNEFKEWKNTLPFPTRTTMRAHPPICAEKTKRFAQS